MGIIAPAPLSDHHQLDEFDCGVDSLNDWLRKRAGNNQSSGASRTYVVTEDMAVIAYYCLASGALATTEASGRIRRNMPDPIPVATLGRLAIDQRWQGKGVGVALLQDAVLRTQQAAEIMGIRGLLVHAISEDAKAFYEHHGFSGTPSYPMTLALSIKRK